MHYSRYSSLLLRHTSGVWRPGVVLIPHASPRPRVSIHYWSSYRFFLRHTSGVWRPDIVLIPNSPPRPRVRPSHLCIPRIRYKLLIYTSLYWDTPLACKGPPSCESRIHRPSPGLGRVSAGAPAYTPCTSKGFALTWYRALTWYSSSARPFAVPDDPQLITGQHGSPSPTCQQLSSARNVCAGGSSEGSTKLKHGTKLGRTLCYYRCY